MSETYYVDRNHLLQGPNVRHELVFPEAGSQPIIKPRSIILHSQSGPRSTPWWNLVAYWRRADINGEAHLIPNMDGTIIQTMPFNRRADCNYKANRFQVPGDPTYYGAISFETQDLGAASLPTTYWPEPQWKAMAGAIAAIGHKYGVAYELCTDWRDNGVGWHSQYPEWSVYVGKTCPGAARIKQVPWLLAYAANLCACAPPGA